MTGRGEVLTNNAELERFSRMPSQLRVYARIVGDIVEGNVGESRSPRRARVPIQIAPQFELTSNLNLMARRVSRWYEDGGTDCRCIIRRCRHIQERISGTDFQTTGGIPFDKNLCAIVAPVCV